LNTRLNIITCCLFGLILMAPVTLTMTGTALTRPLEENRLREKFPSLASCEFSRLDECFKKVDSWFNDNYQPRDLLTKLKTQIDYSVFSTSDKVHIGSDSWLFYRSTMDIQKVAIERMPQSDFDNLLASLDALDRYLGRRNIQLIVLPMPLKDVIYPEYLPMSAPNLPKISRYQQLRQWLAGHESIITIDAYDHLTRRKNDAHAFHKTDFHWNDPAGYLFAQKLVNKLWEIQSGEPGALWDEPLSVEERVYSGGQANFLPLLATPREKALFLDPDLAKPKGKYTDSAATGFWTYIYDGTDDPRGKLDGLVVVGDSFFDALHRSGIDSYFSSVHRASLQPDRFPEIYANIPDGTRYLILEFIETDIFSYSVHGLSVPEAGTN